MQFTILSEVEFRKFLDTHPLRTFMQTPEMGKVMEGLGYISYYVGVKKDGNIVAATMMLSRLTHLGFYQFYAPRGLLVDYEDIDILRFFTNSLKIFIKKHHGYTLLIDPYYITYEKDIDGNNVVNGVNHQVGVNNLSQVGFIKSKNIRQGFKLMFALNLEKNKDDIFKSFKSLPKRMIKKAMDNDIIIREAKYQELHLVEKLIDETGERKHFKSRNLSYYQSLYNSFHDLGQVKFMLAELDLKVYQKKKREIINKLINDLKQSNNNSKKKEKEIRLEMEKKLLADSRNMIVDFNGKVLLSSGVFILYGDEVIYLFGGNKREYMKLGASYLMQWTMISDAIDNNFKKYNFYGISSTTKDDGVYNFKRGFNGYVEELIGDYELPVNSWYYLNKLLHYIKSKH